MAVYVNNITVNCGTDFTQDYDLFETGGKVIDLTGFTMSAALRKHRGSGTSVSFTTSFVNRSQGKIKLFIPSWISGNLKPGRYLYDVLLTSPGGAKSIIVEGNVNARAGISTGCNFSLPTSAQRLCIAVVDENAGTQTFAGMYTKWENFRTTYPNRTFYLLQPTPIGCCGTDSALGTGFGSLVDNNTYNTLHCPDNFLNETTVNTGRLIGQ